jgi:hypothetical protein
MMCFLSAGRSRNRQLRLLGQHVAVRSFDGCVPRQGCYYSEHDLRDAPGIENPTNKM